MNPELRRRGIYMLPNLLTTAALFAGFYAIVQAMNRRFEHAAVAIFIAMVLDGLDGRVARLTRTQSAFGAEYDSLSDMVSFGVAPALVMYEWALKGMGKVGLGRRLHLLRRRGAAAGAFQHQYRRRRQALFPGPAQPGCGGAGRRHGVGAARQRLDAAMKPRWYACALTIFAGVTMVSNVRSTSGKDINLRRSVPFIMVAAIALALALVSSYPPGVLFAPVPRLCTFRLRHGRHRRVARTPAQICCTRRIIWL